MAVIKGYIDPFWHEEHLTILILNQGALEKPHLFERLAWEQASKFVLGERQITHSTSAYRYWIKRRKDQRLISESGKKLELTSLGKWLANSKLGTLFDRDGLVSLICPQCSKLGHLVLLKPLTHTAETNAKGRLFMDVQCTRCEYSVPRMGITETLSKSDFIRFYNQAVEELRGIVKGGQSLD